MAVMLAVCGAVSGCVPPRVGQRTSTVSATTSPVVKIDTTAFTVVDVPAQDSALQGILAREVQKAIAQHHTPVVEFWAPWCGSCQLLTASLSDPRMVDAFRGIYLIRLNRDDWDGKLAGIKLPLSLTKIPFVKGVPAFYALDYDGTITGETIEGVDGTTPESMAPPLKQYFTSVIAHFTTLTAPASQSSLLSK